MFGELVANPMEFIYHVLGSHWPFRSLSWSIPGRTQLLGDTKPLAKYKLLMPGDGSTFLVTIHHSFLKTSHFRISCDSGKKTSQKLRTWKRSFSAYRFLNGVSPKIWQEFHNKTRIRPKGQVAPEQFAADSQEGCGNNRLQSPWHTRPKCSAHRSDALSVFDSSSVRLQRWRCAKTCPSDRRDRRWCRERSLWHHGMYLWNILMFY